eukprot:scaffold7403_cov277-Pinguiococcus_pyrenoidosus.AAC.11
MGKELAENHEAHGGARQVHRSICKRRGSAGTNAVISGGDFGSDISANEHSMDIEGSKQLHRGPYGAAVVRRFAVRVVLPPGGKRRHHQGGVAERFDPGRLRSAEAEGHQYLGPRCRGRL